MVKIPLYIMDNENSSDSFVKPPSRAINCQVNYTTTDKHGLLVLSLHSPVLTNIDIPTMCPTNADKVAGTVSLLLSMNKQLTTLQTPESGTCTQQQFCNDCYFENSFQILTVFTAGQIPFVNLVLVALFATDRQAFS